MWEGAHAYLTNPAHMYDAAADFLVRTHVIAQPGGLDAFVSPPPVAVLAIPVALLPKNIAVPVWTALDAAALLAGLVLLLRVLAPRHRLAMPIFWLAAGYFPPLFAAVSSGQRGGALLPRAAASLWVEPKLPAAGRAVGGLVAALQELARAII